MVGKLTENWILKLISLTFALILWFFVMGERRLEVGYAVPLELENIPAGMMVGNEIPALVDVRISGPRTLLMNLQPNDIRIAVNLKDLQPGLTSFKRLEERLNLPTALKVTRLSPAFIDVKLERVREKKVVVQPVLRGTPDDGYRVASIKAEPPHATIEGAESEIKEVIEITTEPIDVEGARETFTSTVPLVYRGKFTALKDQKSAEVQVTIVPIAAGASVVDPIVPARAEDTSRRSSK